jgi:hypothetical protein
MLPCHQLIFPSKTWFFGIYLNFQQHKSLKNQSKFLHHKSKHHGTKPMHPSSLRAFQRHQEHDLKHPGLVNFIITKQKKLLSFINRWDEVIKILSF